MAHDTSTTLLRGIASDTWNPRWGEFVTRYRPMLATYTSRRFPLLSADDLVQETFVAVAKVLPNGSCAVSGTVVDDDEEPHTSSLERKVSGVGTFF